MELKEALYKRRSIRAFTDEEVSENDINELLHASMSGPSACNKKPWEFYVITNKEILVSLKDVSRFTKINAKLAIVVCGSLTRALPVQLSDFWIQDCSAATENILLRATDLGLGAVWCGVYPMKKAQARLSSILDLPNKHVPLNIIFIGHPLEEATPRDQYEEKRIHYIK